MRWTDVSPHPTPGGRRTLIAVGTGLVLALLVASLALGWWSGGDGETGGEEACRGDLAQQVPPHPAVGRPEGEVASAEGEVAHITVTDRRRQRFQGWGISVTGQEDPIVATTGLSRPAVRHLDRLVFRKQGINLIRVFGPGPQPGGGEGRVWSQSDLRLRFMRRVRPYGVRFTFTGGGAPTSMREEGTGALKAGFETAYARFLARNLEIASEAGAPFRWAGIGNETDINGAFWLAMQPSQAAAVYRELAAQIGRRHLDIRLMLGDNEGWAKSYEYACLAFAAGRVRKLASVVASHPYSDAVPPVMRRLGSFATGRGLSLWMTEWSIGCPPCQDSPDIRQAIPWADQISYDLNAGQVQAWFLFPGISPPADGGNGAIVVFRQGDPSTFYATKRFPLIRQFTSAAKPGARRYETLVSDPVLRAVAFRRGRATTLVVTNDAPESRTAVIDMGRRRGVLRSRRTSQDENFRPLPTRPYRGDAAEAELPPLSVTTFRLTAR